MGSIFGGREADLAEQARHQAAKPLLQTAAPPKTLAPAAKAAAHHQIHHETKRHEERLAAHRPLTHGKPDITAAKPAQAGPVLHALLEPSPRDDRISAQLASNRPTGDVVSEVIASARADQAKAAAPESGAAEPTALIAADRDHSDIARAGDPDTDTAGNWATASFAAPAPTASTPLNGDDNDGVAGPRQAGVEPSPAPGAPYNARDALEHEIASAQGLLLPSAHDDPSSPMMDGRGATDGAHATPNAAHPDRSVRALIAAYVPEWLSRLSPPDAFAWFTGIGLVIAGLAGAINARRKIDD
ncbi:MAG TPA: hypothetical protein VKY65_10615 [Alphaproteobacteria bacterium]|nr:hypothetical protein [Alphaproteobacteria bacterium]